MAEIITPKRQAVVDRLRRRIESYRRHQSDCIPRFNQSFTGIVEQNIQDTLALKQRFLESKAKRAAKKTEKKIPDNPLQSLHAVTQFVPKRSAGDDHGHERDGYGHGEGPPPPKQQPKQPNEPLTKFSVEIVQQLEFTTTSNNSQISTNVTVKALNTSVKSDLSTSTVSPQPQPQPSTPRAGVPSDLVECKQEQEDNPEFVDLEQCAAALEKDAAANGGNSFPGFSDLIGDETSDAIITSDAFKDLISEISDFHPAFLKELDFDGSDLKHHTTDNQNNHHHHQPQQHVFKTEEDSKSNIVSSQRVNVQQQQQQRMYSSNMDFSKAELSPAAQTLKQMAEQHQHKTQLGMNFNPTSRASGKPYSDFQYNGNDFIGSPQNNNSGSQSFKPMMSQSPKSNFVSSDNIKQEVFSAQNSPGVYSPGSGKGNQTPTGQPRLSSGFKQQYSPYGSPGAHGSPQYTPRAPSQGAPPPQAPPPRPPSCPTSTTLQINQAQQLHISQSQGQQIQVSMAQNLCTEMKGSNAAVSVAAQQGLYLSPVSSESYCSVSQSQSINFTQQSMRHRVPGPGPVQVPVPQQHPQDKMMHPQMIRVPQQQVRPPPPEYKSSQQQLPQLHPSMLQQRTASFPPQHRITQQPIPPSGPMMRPQPMPQSGGYMLGNGAPRLQYARPSRPPAQAPALHTSSPEWRHLVMQQQQQQQRPNYHQAQGVVFGVGDLQMAAGQMQQVSHMAQHQSLAMQHTNPQMSVNLQMQQSMGGGGGRQPATSQMNNFPPTTASYSHNHSHTQAQGGYNHSAPSSYPLPLQLPSSSDFSLDFLEQHQFTDQDLLNSLESGASFNLQDIL